MNYLASKSAKRCTDCHTLHASRGPLCKTCRNAKEKRAGKRLGPKGWTNERAPDPSPETIARRAAKIKRRNLAIMATNGKESDVEFITARE